MLEHDRPLDLERGGHLPLVLREVAIEDLATLPSREELLGKLLGLLNSPAQRLVTVLNGPSRSLVQVLKAYAEKQGLGAASAA